MASVVECGREGTIEGATGDQRDRDPKDHLGEHDCCRHPQEAHVPWRIGDADEDPTAVVVPDASKATGEEGQVGEYSHDDGDHRRDPQPPAQTAIERPGAREAADGAWIGEAVDPLEPRSFLDAGEISELVLLSGRAGDHHPTDAGCGGALERDLLCELDPRRCQLAARGFDARARRTGRNYEKATTFLSGERTDCSQQPAVGAESLGDTTCIGAAFDQVAGDDHHAASLPPFEVALEGPCGRGRGLGRFSRQQEASDHKDAAGQWDFDDQLRTGGRVLGHRPPWCHLPAPKRPPS